jgi:hypothetical protein
MAKRMIDLNSLRRHPRAGEAMVELLEMRGEILTASEASRRFPEQASRFHAQERWFVETLAHEQSITLTAANPYHDQTPYHRHRQRVFEVGHRAGFPSVIGTYPEWEYDFLPYLLQCEKCHAETPDRELTIDCDDKGIMAPCPRCGYPLRDLEPFEETLEQALRRRGDPS